MPESERIEVPIADPRMRCMPSLGSSLITIGVCFAFAFILLQAYLQTSLLQVDADVPEGSVFQVFYDIGRGFNEDDSIRYIQNDQTFSRRILLPQMTQSVRIDPVNNDQQVRFRKLIFKPSGYLRSIDLPGTEDLQLHAISHFEKNEQGRSLFIPEQGTSDPYIVLNLREPGEMSWRGFVTWGIGIAFILLSLLFLARVFVIFGMIFLSNLGNRFQKTYSARKYEPLRRLHFLSCLVTGFVIAIVLHAFNTCSTEHRYSIRFKMKSPESESIGVFFDQGYGFSDRDLVFRKIKASDRKKTHLIHFDVVSGLLRIRIDPANHPGSAHLEDVRIRKGYGEWHPLDLEKWFIKDGIRVEEKSADQIRISYNEDDPYMVSGPIHIDFENPSFSFKRVFEWGLIFLSVTLLLLMYNYLIIFKFKHRARIILNK